MCVCVSLRVLPLSCASVGVVQCGGALACACAGAAARTQGRLSKGQQYSREKKQVIEMKSAGGWHKGRLSKDSNVEKIMEQVKKGGAVLADEEAPPKDVEREIPVMSGGSVQDEARMALVSDANADRDRIPGEEKTLGLTIETGKSSKRNLEDKIQLDACGEETKLQDYDSMPIGEFGMALMRGMGWKDGEALGV